jgi:hypothetical protein
VVRGVGVQLITVADVSGRLVSQYEVMSDTLLMDVATWNTGTYFVTCRFADGREETHRVVKN